MMNSTVDEEKTGPVDRLFIWIIGVIVYIIMYCFISAICDRMEKMQKQESKRKISAFYESRWMVTR